MTEEPLHILLVDDDEIDRMAARRALHASGIGAFEMTEAEDADAAREALDAAVRPVDCVLLDLRLPRVDGLTLLRRLRADGVDAPVVMLTGQGDEETAVEIMKSGAADYLSKGGLTPERLGRSVQQAVRVQRAERAAAAARRALEAAVAEKSRLLAVAEEANRAKDEFLAILSHELRTPLNAILGWARMLQDGELSAEKASRAAATIVRNAQTQTQLIEDLLDVSRIISGKLRISSGPVDLPRAIEAAVEIVRPTAEAKSVRLKLSIGRTACAVVGDEARIQQVIWNLLSNAVKFTPSGGQVAVSVEGRGDSIVIAVRDDGEGIAPEFLPHVFERFRQADSSSTRPQGGLGLGLSIVRHLVELHGGSVAASSEGAGRGATFTVTLPCASAPVRSETPTDRLSLPGVEATLAGVRVLLVDDDVDGREMMFEALTMYGASVVNAGSAAQARAALDQDVPDVLVSDVGMPGEDGYALIRSIRARPASEGGRVPAVALTGYAGLDDQRRAREAGFQKHVTKPVDIATLVRVVASLKHSRRA